MIAALIVEPKMQIKKLACVYLLLTLAALGAFWHPLYVLFVAASHSDLYSHTLFVLPVSAAFLYAERERFLPSSAPAVIPALIVMFLAVLTVLAALLHFPALAETLLILALVLFLTAFFVLCFGTGALRSASFPFLFLMLMVPLPQSVLEFAIVSLQHWSADLTAVMFSAFGIPFHRDGMVFDLPGVSILVAEECSGIHSSIALLVTVIIAAHMFLKSAWKRWLLYLLIVPVAVFKNAVRIATLSSLAIYVDRSFLFGRLHREGGVIFFLIGLAILMACLQFLRSVGKKSYPLYSPASH